ncbi:TonB-dependent hemoglobin/transferrin/lactoferrin family receptor [Dongia sp.]|uniref:TonB-dependent hemoglobin/transferrin/lactoferrin family receptor n=1 Tax=Dongia sp. TaxID=1977262 RepID=UPI0035AE679E
MSTRNVTLVATLFCALAGGASADDPAALPGTEESVVAQAQTEEGDTEGEEQILLDPLTVTGTKVPTPRDEVPATIEVIDAEEIERKQDSTVGDILNDIPGVEMEGGPKGSQMQPNIRGFGGTGWGSNRVVTTIDGARQNVGAAHGGSMFIDPDVLSQVEVLKGTGSTLYGSGAIGGVVALTTKDAADFLGEGDTIGFKVKGGFHSVNDEFLASTTLAAQPIDEVDFLGNFTYRNSEDYETGSGSTLDDTAVDILSGLVKLGLDPAEGHRIELSGLLFSDEENILATDVDNANFEYDADHDIRKSTATAHYTFDSPDTDLLNLQATLYRDDTDIEDDGDTYDRVTKTSLTTTGLDIFNTAEFDTGWAKHSVTFGTEYYHDTGSGRVNGEEQSQNPDASQDVVGVYTQYALKLFDQLTLTPGLRWDYYQTNPEGNTFDDRNDDRLSPKVGLNWQPLEWASIYGSYSQGYRAPSIRELYISGTHFAIGGPFNNVFVPNPDLKPETSETWEGGLRLSFEDVLMPGDGLRFNASYYNTEAKNFIDGDVVMDFATFTFTTTPVNVPRAEIEGVEVGLTYDSKYAFFSGGYSRIRGDNKTDDEPLTSIPADKLMVTVGGKIPALDLSAGISNEIAWAQHRIEDETLAVDGYHIVGLFASWVPEEGPLAGFRVDAGIENLFDNSYERYLALEEAPGRDYRIALSYSASF